MPTFRQQTGGKSGIGNLIMSLVGNGDQPTAKELMEVDRAAAATNHSTALSEKIRTELESARRSEETRRDPTLRRSHAARAANLPNASYADDIEEHFQHGAPLPAHITPAMVRAYQSQMGSVGAVDFATGKTNGQQIAATGSTLLADAVRGAISETTDPVKQNTLKASIPGAGYREPFSNVSPAGLVTNQESGDVTTGNEPLLSATVKRIAAQAGQAGAAANLSGVRADDIKATQPARIKNITDGKPAKPRTAAQEARDEAYAARQKALAGKAQREEQDAARTEVGRKARRDPTMKDRKLGNWNPDENAFEVLDKAGKIIGYYD